MNAGPAAAVCAAARFRATAGPGRGTVLPLLAGSGPLALRRTPVHGMPDAAGITVVGAMSAPLGGDRLAVEGEVGPGARLVVGASAATVALPGPNGERAAYDVRLAVADAGTLHWLPEPLICAEGSDLRTTTRVDLAPTARLLLREEQILGRHAEEPGRLTSRLTVHHGGRPLLDQELSFGPGVPGAAGTLGGHRAVGQLLLADPAFAHTPAAPRTWGGDAQAALTPLAGPAVLVTAVATDGLRLRRILDEALTAAFAARDRAADQAAERAAERAADRSTDPCAARTRPKTAGDTGGPATSRPAAR